MVAEDPRRQSPLRGVLLDELAGCEPTGIRPVRVARARRHLSDRSWDNGRVAGEIAHQIIALSRR